MGNVITELPVEFDGNVNHQSATREKDILGFSVKAPIYNILTNDIINKPAKNGNSNDNRIHVVKDTGIVELTDLYHTEGSWNGFLIYYLPKLNPEHTYKLFYRVVDYDNYNGSGFIIGMSFGYASKNSGDSTQTYCPLYTTNKESQLQMRTFTYKPPTRYNGSQRMMVWVGVEGYFNANYNNLTLQFYGLYDSTEYGDIGTDDIKDLLNKDNMNLITSNEYTKLGNYKMSKDVARHLRQLERNIERTENKDLFKIDWR